MKSTLPRGKGEEPVWDAVEAVLTDLAKTTSMIRAPCGEGGGGGSTHP